MVSRCLEVSIWISMLLLSSSRRFLLISICWRKASRSCSLSWSLSARLCWLEWAWTSAGTERGGDRAGETAARPRGATPRGQELTLDVADVGPLRGELAAGLICDLLLETLDLAAQV